MTRWNNVGNVGTTRKMKEGEGDAAKTLVLLC